MTSLDLIIKNFIHLIAIHEVHASKEPDEKERAYLIGMANGVRAAMKVVNTVYDIDDRTPVPSFPLGGDNPYSWSEDENT